MVRLRATPYRVALACGLAGFALAYMAPAFGWSPPLALRNDGDSLPKGWYVYDHPAPARVGEIVAVRNPKGFNLWWLMKRVEATAGAVYCWRADLGTHTLDGRVMPAPLPEAIAMGVPVWKGCGAVPAGEIVGYGISRDSYDSRYFGPVRESDLFGVYRPVSRAGAL